MRNGKTPRKVTWRLYAWDGLKKAKVSKNFTSVRIWNDHP
jgi:hypothetical protein